MTDPKPVFRSPITASRPAIAAQPAGTRHLTLSDLTGAPVVLIQCESGDVLQEWFPGLPALPGTLVDVGDGLLACLTPKRFYLFGKSPAADLPSAGTLDEHFAGAARFAHATDLTHGKTVLRLVGPLARELVSKICGLDLRDESFPNLHAAETLAAKVTTLVARYDEEDTLAYFLHVSRPLGQYFWEVVWDAGQEFGIARA